MQHRADDESQSTHLDTVFDMDGHWRVENSCIIHSSVFLTVFPSLGERGAKF